MENPDNAKAETAPLTTPRHSFTVVRALLSAAVFGTMGWLVGRFLGHRGNDASSRMVESVMKWSVGGFCATMAAYSSLKASEHEDAIADEQAAKNAAAHPVVTDQLDVAGGAAPQARVDAAAHEGLVQGGALQFAVGK